jgi:hypothetical protein
MHKSDYNNAGTLTQSRRWTDDEQTKLFEAYFDRLAGVCPVCFDSVGMMMEHKRDAVVLRIKCRSCGNATVVAS